MVKEGKQKNPPNSPTQRAPVAWRGGSRCRPTHPTPRARPQPLSRSSLSDSRGLCRGPPRWTWPIPATPNDKCAPAPLDEATLVAFSNPWQQPERLGGRPALPGCLCDETSHLPAPLAVEAEGQACDIRPRPAAPLDGPAGPLGNDVPNLPAPAALRVHSIRTGPARRCMGTPRPILGEYRCSTCRVRARAHFYPQHWLLFHMGRY